MKTFYLLYIVLIIGVLSCNNHGFEANDMDVNYFFDNGMGTLHGGDTLYLYARFRECGEFGGHKEKMIITKPDDVFLLDYYRYEVDCDVYETPLFQKLNYEKTIELTVENKESISRYMMRMIKSKIAEGYRGAHVGCEFSVINLIQPLL